jgi:hypothetical protein
MLNYYGHGMSSDVTLEHVNIHGLKGNAVEVPALIHADGTFMQGPARDLIRVFDIASDHLQSLINAEYEGNFLADVYFAFWKLSNDYYVARVFNSTCGNFGSNATMPYSYNVGRCVAGVAQDASLKPRDVALLQKRYFGGLSVSQALYEWATTPGASLHTLMMSSPESTSRRSSKHWIMCDRGKPPVRGGGHSRTLVGPHRTAAGVGRQIPCSTTTAVSWACACNGRTMSVSATREFGTWPALPTTGIGFAVKSTASPPARRCMRSTPQSPVPEPACVALRCGRASR